MRKLIIFLVTLLALAGSAIGAYDYDTFSRADNSSMGSTEGLGTAYKEFDAYWSISDQKAYFTPPGFPFNYDKFMFDDGATHNISFYAFDVRANMAGSTDTVHIGILMEGSDNDTIDNYPLDPVDCYILIEGIGSSPYDGNFSYHDGYSNEIVTDVKFADNASHHVVIGHNSLTETCFYQIDSGTMYNVTHNQSVNLTPSGEFYVHGGGLSTLQLEVDNLVVCLSEDFGCAMCTPNWTCSGYGDCNISDLQPCNETVDENACGEAYVGDYSEFTPQACNYCSEDIQEYETPTGSCLTNDTQFNVTYWLDLNYTTCCDITGIGTDCHIDNGSYDNVTNWQACNYCTEDIVYQYTAWGVCIAPQSLEYRVGHYIDNNYATCCQVTSFLTDCHIDNGSYTNTTYSQSCLGAYTPADMPGVATDIMGEAGIQFKYWIPLLLLAVVVAVAVGAIGGILSGAYQFAGRYR